MSKGYNPIILIIMDGWGISTKPGLNAIRTAKTPNFDRLWKEYPHTKLSAAEEAVGLPKTYIGNSEVGHINLGAGRTIDQELVLLNKSIKDRSFFRNKALIRAIDDARKNSSTLHLMGLLSDGGVHSHIDHLFALMDMAKNGGIKNLQVHCFLDGRDVPQKSAKRYIKKVESKIKKIRLGRIATVIGRYYAMDRDNRWNREHKAYDSLVNSKGYLFDSAIEAVESAYKRKETDEFVKPSIIRGAEPVKDGDSIIFFNFREDRARQLTRAFVEGTFNRFRRKKMLKINFTCITQYDPAIKANVAFPPHAKKDVLGEVLSKKRLPQLRIAETEKYAHVTFFFNSGRDGPFPKEDRILIPSPKVSTYDLSPSMSAPKITKEVIRQISLRKYPAIILNFANCDMVGHTGIFKAAVKAVETVDISIGKVVEEIKKQGGIALITADHGNAEEMSGPRMTTHTTNKVPFILVSDKHKKARLREGLSISNVAPTILELMGIKIPPAMDQSIIR